MGADNYQRTRGFGRAVLFDSWEFRQLDKIKQPTPKPRNQRKARKKARRGRK